MECQFLHLIIATLVQQPKCELTANEHSMYIIFLWPKLITTEVCHIHLLSTLPYGLIKLTLNTQQNNQDAQLCQVLNPSRLQTSACPTSRSGRPEGFVNAWLEQTQTCVVRLVPLAQETECNYTKLDLVETFWYANQL